MKPTPTLGTAYTPGPSEHSTDSNRRRNKSTPKESKCINGEEMEHFSHFGKNGHNKDVFFKRIRYPEWWPNKKKQDKTKTKATFVESATSPILGLSGEQ